MEAGRQLVIAGAHAAILPAPFHALLELPTLHVRALVQTPTAIPCDLTAPLRDDLLDDESLQPVADVRVGASPVAEDPQRSVGSSLALPAAGSFTTPTTHSAA